jgi:hypothetical protein
VWFSLAIHPSAKPPSSVASLTASSTLIKPRQLVLIIKSMWLNSIRSRLNFKFGTLPVRKNSVLSVRFIIEMRLVPLQSSISHCAVFH